MNASNRAFASGDDVFAIAGDWLLRLQADDIAQEEFSAWLQWYEASLAHRQAFDQAQVVFEAARAIPEDARARWAGELMTVGGETRTGLSESLSARALRWLRRTSPFGPANGYAAAVIAAVGLVSGGLLLGIRYEPLTPKMTATYQTPRAVHRTESLPDGSTVRLGARSSVSLSFSGETRYLVLESGEAYFTVAKDAARPFIVQAGPVRVRAVGTQFNVRRAADGTTVSVSEGTVEVTRDSPQGRQASMRRPADELRLTAGQLVDIESSVAPPVVKAIQVASVASWQAGQLEFINEPLRSVVATVNRYSPRQIVVTDQGLGDLRITGTVKSDHTEEWLRALPVIIPARVIEISKETVLISPPD